MKNSLFIAILLLQSVCFGHEYQRAEYRLQCYMTATKQTLAESEKNLAKSYTYSLEGQLVDGKFLSLVRDNSVTDSAVPAVRITEDFSTSAARPAQRNYYSFVSPFARPNSMYGVQVNINSYPPAILNESVTTNVFGLMRFQNTGKVKPMETQDVIQLFNAFGEPMTNPQDLVIEMKTPEETRIVAYPGQSVAFENVMQMHFPETINGGASYHFRMACISSLMPKY